MASAAAAAALVTWANQHPGDRRNRAATREQQVAAGATLGRGLRTGVEEPGSRKLRHRRPADGEVRFASGSGLASYDGVAITGSALNLYDVARTLNADRPGAGRICRGVPFFGSCWAAGGVSAAAARTPQSAWREFGFARRIELGDAGRRHAMFRGKPPVYEAITVHGDDIEQLMPEPSRTAYHGAVRSCSISSPCTVIASYTGGLPLNIACRRPASPSSMRRANPIPAKRIAAYAPPAALTATCRPAAAEKRTPRQYGPRQVICVQCGRHLVEFSAEP